MTRTAELVKPGDKVEVLMPTVHWLKGKVVVVTTEGGVSTYMVRLNCTGDEVKASIEDIRKP